MVLVYHARIMTIKMNIDGIEVSVTDPVEAAALLRALKTKQEIAGEKPPSAGNQGNGGLTNVHGFPISNKEHIDVEVAAKALHLLKAIRSSREPLPSNEVMAALGAGSPNAVGGTSKKINNILADLGFRKETVYKNPKRARQPRTWSAGRNIEKAIEAIEERIESQK